MNKELIKAFDILKSVYFENAYANIELNKTLRNKEDNLNYALITKLVYGVLEKDIYLDYVVKNFVKPTTKPIIKLILKLGRYVSEEVNSIPDYTIVNELVNLSKNYGDRYVSGFVNATLKNIIKTQVELPTNKLEYLSVKYSHPVWIIDELLKAKDYNFVENLLAYKLTTLTHIRVLGDYDKFKADLDTDNIKYETTPINTFYVDYDAILNEKYKGRFVPQGIPSIICAKSLEVRPNTLMLDSTSAPGGKTALVAGSDKSVRVVACDLYPHRVDLIKRYVKNLNIENVEAIVQDATKYRDDWKEKFDYVLCDVPCSGTGVINKKPDILLNRTREKLKQITKTQYAILENNSKYVKKGGVLLYSTCSILDAENGQIINKFLQNHKDFELTKIDTRGINVENNNNMFTFYPHISNTEGFFIGRLVRK